MTDQERKTMEMALEALENGTRVQEGEGGTQYQPYLANTARTALRQALEQPQTSVANLDVFTGVTFSNPPYGGWIGDVELVKWLVINRSKDYWEHKEKNND